MVEEEITGNDVPLYRPGVHTFMVDGGKLTNGQRPKLHISPVSGIPRMETCGDCLASQRARCEQSRLSKRIRDALPKNGKKISVPWNTPEGTTALVIPLHDEKWKVAKNCRFLITMANLINDVAKTQGIDMVHFRQKIVTSCNHGQEFSVAKSASLVFLTPLEPEDHRVVAFMRFVLSLLAKPDLLADLGIKKGDYVHPLFKVRVVLDRIYFNGLFTVSPDFLLQHVADVLRFDHRNMKITMNKSLAGVGVIRFHEEMDFPFQPPPLIFENQDGTLSVVRFMSRPPREATTIAPLGQEKTQTVSTVHTTTTPGQKGVWARNMVAAAAVAKLVGPSSNQPNQQAVTTPPLSEQSPVQGG